LEKKGRPCSPSVSRVGVGKRRDGGIVHLFSTAVLGEKDTWYWSHGTLSKGPVGLEGGGKDDWGAHLNGRGRDGGKRVVGVMCMISQKRGPFFIIQPGVESLSREKGMGGGGKGHCPSQKERGDLQCIIKMVGG